jgi:hypothetical protein
MTGFWRILGRLKIRPLREGPVAEPGSSSSESIGARCSGYAISCIYARYGIVRCETGNLDGRQLRRSKAASRSGARFPGVELYRRTSRSDLELAMKRFKLIAR